jgi:hypothetical protein
MQRRVLSDSGTERDRSYNHTPQQAADQPSGRVQSIHITSGLLTLVVNCGSSATVSIAIDSLSQGTSACATCACTRSSTGAEVEWDINAVWMKAFMLRLKGQRMGCPLEREENTRADAPALVRPEDHRRMRMASSR